MSTAEPISIAKPALQASLQQEGYALIPDFLAPAQIQQARDFFYQTLPQSGVEEPFFTTHWSSNKAYRLAVHQFITQLLQPAANRFFSRYKTLLGYYLYKKPHTANAVFMHQDWSLVEEEKHTGYIFWIPLVDTSVSNGCFQVVPGSHRTFAAPRGSGIPQIHTGISEHSFVSLPLLAGQAIVFDQRLLHSSPPNLSATDRLAAGLIVIPAQAPVVHYSLNKDTNTISMHPMPDTFLLDNYYDYKNKTSSSLTPQP